MKSGVSLHCVLLVSMIYLLPLCHRVFSGGIHSLVLQWAEATFHIRKRGFQDLAAQERLKSHPGCTWMSMCKHETDVLLAAGFPTSIIYLLPLCHSVFLFSTPSWVLAGLKPSPTREANKFQDLATQARLENHSGFTYRLLY